MNHSTLVLILSLAVPILAMTQEAEKPFQAIPEYEIQPHMKDEEVGDRKVVQLDRETIDSIAGFVQGFYKKYNPIPLAEALEDPEIENYLAADYVQRMKRAIRAAKISGEIYYVPGLSDYNDLYKYLAAFTTDQPDQYIVDFAIGSSKEEEGPYGSHIWVIVKKEGDGWRITDLRDMGNG